MFRSVQVMKLFGIPIKVDASWLVLLLLLTWSLATAIFPANYPELETSTYWVMGFAAALSLLLSILLHELGHAVVAKYHQIKMRGITLFIFGGIAEMSNEPPHARAEFLVALAGPVVSVLIAIGSLAFAWLLKTADSLTPFYAVFQYVAVMNALLVSFNLVPAFPLDGGRVLRSILWYLWDDLNAATRVTTAMGSAFGTVLIVMGVLTMMQGAFIAGVWLAVIGLFLRGAANMSFQHLQIRNALHGESVSRFMQTEIRSVTPQLTIQQLVDNYFYRFHHKMFPVVANDQLLGCVTTRDIKSVPMSEWSDRRVSDIVQLPTEANTITSDADAFQTLNRMNNTGNSRLLVTQDHQLVGVVTLKDMLGFLSMKIEFEEGQRTPQAPTHLKSKHAA